MILTSATLVANMRRHKHEHAPLLDRLHSDGILDTIMNILHSSARVFALKAARTSLTEDDFISLGIVAVCEALNRNKLSGRSCGEIIKYLKTRIVGEMFSALRKELRKNGKSDAVDDFSAVSSPAHEAEISSFMAALTLRSLFASCRTLTAGEKVLLEHLSRGVPQNELADLLGVQPSTISNAKTRAFGKLRAAAKDPAD